MNRRPRRSADPLHAISPAVRHLVEAAGYVTQSLGMGRVLGQIYACCYFSPTPRTLDTLTAALGISKGSASMGVRQLEQWGALERVWIKGDRKDYYRARDAFGSILKHLVQDMAGKRIEASATALGEAEAELQRRAASGAPLTDEDAFVRQRLAEIRRFQEKTQTLWNSMFVHLLLR